MTLPVLPGNRGQHRTAAEEATTVNRRTKDDGSSALKKGFDAIARQSWFEAEELFADFVDSDDADVEAWLGWAIIQQNLGFRDEAASAVRQALAALADDELEIQVLGELYSSIGLEQDALPFLLRAADTASGDLDELERIAGLMLKIGYVRWGVDIAERVLDSDSDRAEAWLILGLSSFIDSDWDGAIKAFEECIMRDPGHAMAHLSLGTVKLEQNLPEQALEHFDFVISLPGEDEEDMRYACSAMIRRARALFSIGRREEAMDSIARASGMAGDSPTALFDIGFFFLDDLKSADEALPFLQRAAALDPYDPFKQATLAHAQLEAEKGSFATAGRSVHGDRPSEKEDVSDTLEGTHSPAQKRCSDDDDAHSESPPSKEDDVYQLRIELAGIRPPIWRRVLVPASFTLEQLHSVIQMVFEWHDAHMHDFRVRGTRYSRVADLEGVGFSGICDEASASLESIVVSCGGEFTYTYDFGDMWVHRITVEKGLKRSPGQRYPTCLAGRRAGPPEDIGGVFGYTDLLDAIRHHDEERAKEYIGPMAEDYDPEHFDIEEADDFLKELAHGWANY
jgi:tetratricopeptide (TPR) repeat protein